MNAASVAPIAKPNLIAADGAKPETLERMDTWPLTDRDTAGVATIQLDLEYQWNDIFDPNPQYATDQWKSWFAELITLGQAEGYQIHIGWGARATVKMDASGGLVSATGWPFR